jgi:hypothetical protein
MTDGEFKGEREVLNLEGCIGLGYQTQLGIKEMQRMLITIGIPDGEGAAITHS